MSQPPVGIDLGTTNSLLAVLTEDGPRVLPNALGRELTPSVVAMDDNGDMVVGDLAREISIKDPIRAAARFKAHMGTDFAYRLGKRDYTAVELSAMVLKTLKRDAEARLACEIDRAVVTVPAYFNESQRSATRQAAEIAGLKVQRLINEPTAAAIAHGLYNAGEEATLLVLDLGGGTFDVTLLEVFEGVVEVQGSAGDNRLGGEDFTDAILRWAIREAGGEFGAVRETHPEVFARLRAGCELAKRQLAEGHAAMLALPDLAGEDAWKPAGTRSVTRDRHDQITSNLMERTRQPILRVLRDADTDASDLEGIILVGGASRTRSLHVLTEELLGMAPGFSRDPDQIVAEGAAVQAGLIEGSKGLDDLVVTDVTSFSLGVNTARDVAGRMRSGYFSTVVPRGTTLPCSRVDSYWTLSPEQQKIVFEIYQGESRRVEENERIGELEIEDLPPSEGNQEVQVRFTHDLNGLLQIESWLVVDGQPGEVHEIVLQRGGATLEGQELREALSRLETLKVHPKEYLQNRYLMTRAENIWAELTGEEREALSKYIDAFESALERQDPDHIEIARKQLEAVVARLEK